MYNFPRKVLCGETMGMKRDMPDKKKYIAFSAILDEHTQWFTDLTQNLFYPESFPDLSLLKKPLSFAQYLSDHMKSDAQIFQHEALERLSTLHNDLLKETK